MEAAVVSGNYTGNVMLLAMDVGITTSMMGLFDGTRLLSNLRLTTRRYTTSDEWGIAGLDLLHYAGVTSAEVKGVVIGSVIPDRSAALEEMALRYFGLKALFVESGIRTGMPIKCDPLELDADRVTNSVGAFEKYGGPCIIVEFETSLAFDAVSERGEYLGCVLAPGVGISATALFNSAAQLPSVEITRPRNIIGTNTDSSIQAGLYHGYKELVDGILDRMKEVLGHRTRVVLTGEQAKLFGASLCHTHKVDETLSLEGLRIIWERNAATARTAAGPNTMSIHPRR